MGGTAHLPGLRFSIVSVWIFSKEVLEFKIAFRPVAMGGTAHLPGLRNFVFSEGFKGFLESYHFSTATFRLGVFLPVPFHCVWFRFESWVGTGVWGCGGAGGVG